MSKPNSEKRSEPDPDSSSLPEYHLTTSYKKDNLVGPSGDYEVANNSKFSQELYNMKKNSAATHEAGDDQLYSLKNDFLKNLNIIRKQLNMTEINSDSSKQDTPRISSGSKSPKVIQIEQYNTSNSEVSPSVKAVYEIKDETLNKMIPNKWSVNLNSEINIREESPESNYDPPKKKTCHRIKTPIITTFSDDHIELPYSMKVAMNLNMLKKKTSCRQNASSASTQYYTSDIIDGSLSVLDIDKKIDFTQIQVDNNLSDESSEPSRVKLLNYKSSTKHVHLIPNVIIKNDMTDCESQISYGRSIDSAGSEATNKEDQSYFQSEYECGLTQEHLSRSESNSSKYTSSVKSSDLKLPESSKNDGSLSNLSKSSITSEKCVKFSPIREEDFKISLKLLSPKNNSQTLSSPSEQGEKSSEIIFLKSSTSLDIQTLWQKNEDYSNLNTPDCEDNLSKATPKSHTTILDHNTVTQEESEHESEPEIEYENILSCAELVDIFRNSAAIARTKVNKPSRNASSCSCSISEIKTEAPSIKSRSIITKKSETPLDDSAIPIASHITSSLDIPKLSQSKLKFPAIAYISNCFKIPSKEDEADLHIEKSQVSVKSSQSTYNSNIKAVDGEMSYREVVEELLESNRISSRHNDISIVNGKTFELRSKQSVNMEFYDVDKSRSPSPCNLPVHNKSDDEVKETKEVINLNDSDDAVANETKSEDFLKFGDDIINTEQNPAFDDNDSDDDSVDDRLCKCLCFPYLFTKS